jgi:RimJ/RimL family protein N-acetyltransferase
VDPTQPLELSGGKVLLRPFREEELELVHEHVRQSPAQIGELTLERLRVRIARSGRFVEGRLDLAVESGGTLVGTIEARAPAGALPPGVCELGIGLFPEARGRGLGTEAVELLAGRLLADGFARVQASTDAANWAMRRALEKAGFSFEGTLHRFMPDGGRRVDYVLYAVTAADAGR